MGFFAIGMAYLLMLGSGLLVLALCVQTIWRACVRPPGAGKAASCGSCGYEINSLREGRCPECGADLLKSGVITGRMALAMSGSLSAAVIAWTIVMIGVTSIAVGVAFAVNAASRFGPGAQQSYQASISFAPVQAFNNQSQAWQRTGNHRVQFDLDVQHDWVSGVQSGTVTISVADQGPASIAEIDGATREVVVRDPSGAEVLRESGFSRAAAEKLYEPLGLNAADPAVDEELNHLVQLAGQALNQPQGFQYGTPSSGSGGLDVSHSNINYGTMGMLGPGTTADWAIPAGVYGVGAIVYVAGIVWLVRRRARILRHEPRRAPEVLSPPPPSPAA